MAPKFTRLVRFEDLNGDIHYGEAGSDWKADLLGQSVPTYNASNPFEDEFAFTGKEAQVAKARAFLLPNQTLYADLRPGLMSIDQCPNHDRRRIELQGTC